MSPPDRAGWIADQRRRVEELIDEHRMALHDSLDGQIVAGRAAPSQARSRPG